MAKKNMTLEEKMEEAVVKNGAYEVPGNWVWSKLGEVCNKVQYGYTEKASIEKVGPHFLRITDIQENGVNWSSVPYCPISEKDYEKYKLDKGDIVIARTGATTGKNYIISDDVDSVFASYLIRMKINDRIYSKFISYYMYSDLYWKQIMEEQKGIAQPGVNAQKLGALIVPIPPIKEQQRIVDRIESLFEKLDKAKELIEEAREGFEKRKNSVLIKAFTGELTDKWRKNNDISNNKLLDCIMAENIKIKKNFDFADSDKLYELPKKWTWIKLKDICEKFKYGTSAKSQSEGKVPVLRMGNLQQGKLVWNSLVYTSDEEEITKYDLRKGDLLFNRTNSPELVGKTSIYIEELKAIFAGYLIRIRVLNGIDSKYINYFMNSLYAKTRCIEVKSDGVSQSNINAEKLGEFDIPLPSSEEQKEIVKILDKLLEEESKIEELTQLEEQIELIKKSILAKAFRGELGTNCEEDDSALELLKEILSR